MNKKKTGIIIFISIIVITLFAAAFTIVKINSLKNENTVQNVILPKQNICLLLRI